MSSESLFPRISTILWAVKHAEPSIPHSSIGLISPHTKARPIRTWPTASPQPKSKSRAEYQSYVVSKLREQYEQDAKHPSSRPLRGAFITIPGTAFCDSCLLPVTISQVRMQYKIEHQKEPAEDTAYIYWQVMNGDMILALSVKPIDCSPANSRCLICYIAPPCDAHDRDYHEQATYLNCGLPMHHFIFENKHRYLAVSNTFHMGCNTWDFLTYCLEIHRSTGQITLRHAGANALCNHQEITCQFNKDEFDVSKLDYLQVTANRRTVTVKDLIVCFEKQPDLHPTIDTHFKMDPSSAKPKDSSASAKTGDHRAKYSHPRKDEHWSHPVKHYPFFLSCAILIELPEKFFARMCLAHRVENEASLLSLDANRKRYFRVITSAVHQRRWQMSNE